MERAADCRLASCSEPSGPSTRLAMRSLALFSGAKYSQRRPALTVRLSRIFQSSWTNSA